MLCGVTVFAYVTSTVSSLLTTFNTQNIRTQEQQRNIDGFCRSHQIPKLLARKLSGFYDYVLPRQIHAQDKDIISGLPETLQQQVSAMNSPDLGVSCSRLAGSMSACFYVTRSRTNIYVMP